MKLHRFIGRFDLQAPKLTITDEATVNQIKNVLRLGPGDKILLGDGKMNEALAVLTSVEPSGVDAAIEERTRNDKEPRIRTVLYAGIMKGERFEWLVQKAVEAGVSEIAPLQTERTVKLGLQRARLERIAKEAAEQSGRGIVPLLREPARYLAAADEAEKMNELNVFFQLGTDPFPVAKSGAKRIGLFVGPEGGWTNEEFELVRVRKNFRPMNLGALTLRSETAGVIGVYLAANGLI